MIEVFREVEGQLQPRPTAVARLAMTLVDACPCTYLESQVS